MSRLDKDEAEIEASRAPLMDHLIELRKRLIVCVIAFVIAFIVCFYFAGPIQLFLIQPYKAANAVQAAYGNGHQSMFELLAVNAGLHPLPAAGAKAVELITTAPLEQLFTKMKLAGFGAICLAFPVLAYQLYRFVAPGLYRNERGAFLPFLLASPVLFVMGAALVYYVMLPFVMWFSLGQQVSGEGVAVNLLPKISEYLSLVTALLLAFGLCFQMPIIMTLLGLAGIVSSKMLIASWRYAIVAIVVVAAIVTPPDPISQLLLSAPLILLYVMSIWCVQLIELRRKKADATV